MRTSELTGLLPSRAPKQESSVSGSALGLGGSGQGQGQGPLLLQLQALVFCAAAA